MSIADIFTVVIALLALLVNVVFATFQITWSITQDRAKDQKDKKKKYPPTTPNLSGYFSFLVKFQPKRGLPFAGSAFSCLHYRRWCVLCQV